MSKLKLSYPYSAMLQKLCKVPGWPGFVKEISTRVGHEQDVETEITALYEIHKNAHRLLQITSQEIAKPEGYFIAPKFGHGFIEASTVTNRVLDHQDKSACASQCYSIFSRLRNQIQDGESFSIEVKDCKWRPVVADRKRILNHINCWGLVASAFGTGSTIFRLATRTSPSPGYPEFLSANPDGLHFLINKNGFYLHALAPSSTNRIIKKLKEKRKARQAESATDLHVYYFLLDGPVPMLWAIDHQSILKSIRDNELLVVAAISAGRKKGSFNQEKLIYRRDPNPFIDLKNNYFGDSEESRDLGQLLLTQVLIEGNNVNQMIELRPQFVPNGLYPFLVRNQAT